MVVGHVAPEAYVGGTIALVQEGDSITIDAHKLLLELNVDDAEIAAPPRRVEAAGAALHARRAGEVCDARAAGEQGRGDGLILRVQGAMRRGARWGSCAPSLL